MREIEPSALDKNVFQLVGEDWMLVSRQEAPTS